MIIVADTSPISALTRIGQLDLLRKVYKRLIVPDAVFQELITPGHNWDSAKAIQDAEWIEVASVDSSATAELLKRQIDLGESEAIALALKLNASTLLIDELKGRRIAQEKGLAIVGTVGTLLLAKEDGLINELRPLLDALINDDFRLSSKLYHSLLESVGEE